MRILIPALTVLGCLLLPSSPVFARAKENSRDQTTITIDQNTITAHNSVKYEGYKPGETITVTLEFSATCNIVFNGLTLWKVIPFAPPRIVTGEIAGVSGTPNTGTAATDGSVTFNIKFNTLNLTPTGAESGLARLDLVLGVDKDCNLATGDPDGIDTSTTIRVQIWVSTF